MVRDKQCPSFMHATNRSQTLSKLKESKGKKKGLIKSPLFAVKHDLPPPEALKQHHMIGWLVRP